MKSSGVCIQCGLCVAVCNRFAKGAIRLEKNGPVFSNPDVCMRCGHCVAVCPTGYCENPLSAQQEEIGEILPYDTALRFLRTARSCRNFTNQPIPHDLLMKLIDSGRYPQTGGNTQGIRYIVVEGKEKIQSLLEAFCESVLCYSESHSDLGWILEKVIRYKETGIDGILHGCSTLLIALSARDNKIGRESAQFSLTFISLMAPTLGLGTCWAGIFEAIACSDLYGEKISKILDIPDSLALRGAMMIGYPQYKFLRFVERDPLQVRFIN